MGSFGKSGAIFLYSFAGICAIIIVDQIGGFGIYDSIAYATNDVVNNIQTNLSSEEDNEGHVGGSSTKRRKKHKNKSKKGKRK